MTRSALIRSQLGIQTVADTPVAATVQLPGLLTMRHAPNRLLREEYRNSWGGSNVHDDLRLESTGQYVGRCTASTLIYWLSAAIRGNPTVTGAGPYTHAYIQPLTGAIPPLKYLTAYWGDDAGALCAPGVVVSRIVIEGANDAAWTIRADLLGMGVVAGSFAALTTITNETVKNLLTSLFVDSTWAGIGGTLKTGLGYGFTWTWDSGIAGDFTMSNQLNRTDIHRAIPNTTLQLRLKWNADSTVLAVDTINLTRKFIRLQNTGTVNSVIRIDGAYDPMTMDTVADQTDGTTRATLDLVAVEDTARKVEVTVTNNVASV